MDPLEVLNQVSAFYSQAFDKLLAITFGLIGLIGIAVPVLVGWVQLKSLRSEKHSLLNELRKELEAEREQLREHAESEIQGRVKEAEEKYNERFETIAEDLRIARESAEARSFHLQARINSDLESYATAIHDYCIATSHYISANDDANAQRCMDQINNECLPQIDKTTYAREKIEKRCLELIEILKETNTNSRYSNYIQRIEWSSEQARDREPANDTN